MIPFSDAARAFRDVHAMEMLDDFKPKYLFEKQEIGEN
jgi:hypothetical protein